MIKIFIRQVVLKPIIKFLMSRSQRSELPLSNFERIKHEIRPCDVLLVEGRSRVSNVIKVVTQSPWSHAILYLGRLHDIQDPALRKLIEKNIPENSSIETQLIIESELGIGTVISKLSDYKMDHIRICRPRNLNYSDSQKIITYAAGKLGCNYDVRQIFDLARFLFPWTILPRRWRSSLFKFNMGESTKTVCSTLIAESFGSVQFPILPLIKVADDTTIKLYRRNPKLCTPSDFDYSPYFEIIKYPFIDFQDHSAEYRTLPWSHNPDHLEKHEQKEYYSEKIKKQN